MDSEQGSPGPAAHPDAPAHPAGPSAPRPAYREYWEGQALLFDGLSARARPTRVAIGPGGLEIRDGDAAGRYLRGDLALVEKGSDGAFFSLSLKPREGHVLEFRDGSALEWLRASGLLSRPPLAGMSLRGKAALMVLALAAFSAFLYVAGLDLMVDAALKALPRKTDRLLGEAVTKGFSDSLTAKAGPDARRALEKSRRMVESLAPPAGDSIRILVVADSSIKNAFAFPGGHIVVYTGMLRMLETQEEWAGLLAHEGGHIHLRHGMRQVVRAGILAVVTSLVFGDASGLASTVLDNAGTLVNLRYGRRAESEADGFARSRLEAAGYSSSGLASLFRKFLKLQSLPGWAAFLSTHPSTEARIEALEAAGDGREAHGSGNGGGGRPRPLLTAEEWEALKAL